MDEIYASEDPIETSVKKRSDAGGTILEAVSGTQSKQGKFFYTLKFKGEQPVLKSPAKLSSNKKIKPAMASSASGDPGPDPIAKCVSSRVKAGGLTEVIKGEAGANLPVFTL